jgi:hypothetical protein
MLFNLDVGKEDTTVGVAVAVVENEESSSPLPKKAKRSEAEEKILKELADCEELLSSTTQLVEKMEGLTSFFQSIVSNNVNTLLVKEDFPGWTKTWVLSVVEGTTKVTDDFLRFLTAALKAAPTAFEAILEKVLTLCFFGGRKRFTVEVYEEFMTGLVGVFERLRRFPKFVAKLLCCTRDYLIKEGDDEEEEMKGMKKKRKSIAGMESKLWIEQILTPKLRESMGLVVNGLPVGQVMDLWKTFHHNLDVECVKRIISKGCGRLGFLKLLIIIKKV